MRRCDRAARFYARNGFRACEEHAKTIAAPMVDAGEHIGRCDTPTETAEEFWRRMRPLRPIAPSALETAEGGRLASGWYVTEPSGARVAGPLDTHAEAIAERRLCSGMRETVPLGVQFLAEPKTAKA